MTDHELQEFLSAEKTPFQVFGVCDLQKSLGHSPAGQKEILIEGRILNAVRDASGEKPIIPDMKWDLFDTRGFIKYEHDPVTMVKTAAGAIAVTVSTPKNHIGVPLSRQVISDKEVMIKGTLFPHMEYTQDLMTLSKSLDEHNKLHPDKKRTLGFSIEGSYYKKSMTGEYAGIVMNVVISPQAQDETTYLRFVDQQNTEMKKSMNASKLDLLKSTKGATSGDSEVHSPTSTETSTEAYTANNVTVTGGAGGGDTIVHIGLKSEKDEGNKHSQKSKEKKMKFKNRDQAFAHFLNETGNNKDEALKKTNQHYKELEDERQTSLGTMEKSLGAGLEKIQKSITMFAEIASKASARQEQVNDVDLALKKSYKSLVDDDNTFDAMKYVQKHAETNIGIATTQNEMFTALAKSMGEGLAGIADALSFMKSVNATTIEARDTIENVGEDVRHIIRGLRKTAKGITFEVSKLEEAKTISDGERPKGVQLLKSINLKAVEGFLADRGEANSDKPQLATQYFAAQDLVATRGARAFDGMNKSIQAELVEHFEKEVAAQRHEG